MQWWQITLIWFLCFYSISIFILSLRFPEKHLDWNKLDLDDLRFPKDFGWGVATASHQIEGNNHNNWSEFEKNNGLEESGIACDHWNRWNQDFELIKELGVGHYRFSIEWSRIQPTKDVWDDLIVKQYSEMVDDLISKGIEPMITLHHFSHPVWFQDEGGFEIEDNVSYWINFCEIIFNELSDRVKWWCTINEPAVFTTMGYVLGEFPPGARSFKKARSVSKNMMSAHAQCYRNLKKLPNGEDSNIGFVKNINIFDPYKRWNIFHWIQAKILDEMFNKCWLRGLKTGRFRAPSSIFSQKIDGLRGSADFIGVNYYTHLLTTPFMPTSVELEPLKRPWEIRTDFRYPMYAEGLRRSFEMVENLGVPIYVTENGVADKNDDFRPEHIRKHLWITSRAILDGFNVKGFFHWSLMDNFEWAEGYAQRFGLYHVNYETQKRTLKESGKLYSGIIKKNSMPQIVILAGGLGTRLGDLTEKIPKSLVKVNGKPIITHILNWAHGQGCRNALILTGHNGHKFKNFNHDKMSLTFNQEIEPLGTGGALFNSLDLLEDNFILLWGDDYHPIQYEKLLNQHFNSNSKLTMTVTESHKSMNLKHFEGRLINYDKTNPLEDFNGYEAGTSLVSKSIVEKYGKPGKWGWEQTIYSKISEDIFIHLDNTKFWDIGTPDRLSKLEDFFKEGGAR